MPPKALKPILFKIESTQQFLDLVDPEAETRILHGK